MNVLRKQTIRERAHEDIGWAPRFFRLDRHKRRAGQNEGAHREYKKSVGHCGYNSGGRPCPVLGIGLIDYLRLLFEVLSFSLFSLNMI